MAYNRPVLNIGFIGRINEKAVIFQDNEHMLVKNLDNFEYFMGNDAAPMLYGHLFCLRKAMEMHTSLRNKNVARLHVYSPTNSGSSFGIFLLRYLVLRRHPSSPLS